MGALLRLIILLGVGLVIGNVFHLRDIASQVWYQPGTSALLAVALYAATYSIDVLMARRHAKLITAAVTIGVLFKATIIGGIMAVLFGNPANGVRGIAVSQIDPLSVEKLMRKGSPMSGRAKTILRAWSSFDDPMTVLLGLYVPAFIVAPAVGSEPIAAGGWQAYVVGLGLNLVFATLVWLVWRYARTSVTSTVLILVIGYSLLAFSFATAVMCLMMLGLALVGLFLRPGESHKAKVGADGEASDPFERFMGYAVEVCFAVAAILLGILLAAGINPVAGIAMGIVAYVAQIFVAIPLTRRLGWSDRVYLMFAQQLGITAIILALRFEPAYPGTVAIVAPTIVVCNLLHAICNKWVVPRVIALRTA